MEWSYCTNRHFCSELCLQILSVYIGIFMYNHNTQAFILYDMAFIQTSRCAKIWKYKYKPLNMTFMITIVGNRTNGWKWPFLIFLLTWIPNFKPWSEIISVYQNLLNDIVSALKIQLSIYFAAFIFKRVCTFNVLFLLAAYTKFLFLTYVDTEIGR